MQFVTVINRTSRVLEACWNGIRYDVPPGQSALPEIIAEAAKRQNPLMGSEDPYSGQIQSLIAIREHADNESPLEPSTAIERQSPDTHSKPVEVVSGKGGLYAHEVVSPLPAFGNAFVKP